MVIEGGYLRDILAQPRALEDTLSGLDPAVLADTVRRFRERKFWRIVLTGMGGSYWALYPLHLEFLRHGHRSILMETSELIYYLAPRMNLGARTLLIVASQSGRSAEILRLLDLKRPNCYTLAITNTPGAPLAGRADAVVFTRAGEEFTVSCKTYVAALLALEWIAATLGGRSLDESRDELSQAAPAVQEYLGEWRDHVRTLEALLAARRHFFVLGRGTSLATAGTGGLILKESTHCHAEGMSAAAFRHGPWEMLSPALFALVLAGDPVTASLNSRLAADIQEAGAGAALAGPHSDQDAGPSVFRLPGVPAAVRPIVEMLPVEMMTLALASLAGREAGKFERATKVTTSE